MAKTETSEESWTLVRSRRGKREKKPPCETVVSSKPWCPENAEIDPIQESRIMQKIQQSTILLESSKCYQAFLEQLKSPFVLPKILNSLGSERQFQMVIYGIGSIESSYTSRTQLSLALLLKRNFNWIGEIEVFDPVLSGVECLTLERLGCKVILVDEQGRRVATRPTLFFMPHCETILYGNLLEANWSSKLLNQIVVFGNSFKQYQFISELNPDRFSGSKQYVLQSQLYVEECAVGSLVKDFPTVFNEISWLFFQVDPSVKLKRL